MNINFGMENNQFTKISTYCDKCGQACCFCAFYEKQVEKLLNDIQSNMKYYIKYRDEEEKEIDFETFTYYCWEQTLVFGKSIMKYEENKTTIIW